MTGKKNILSNNQLLNWAIIEGNITLLYHIFSEELYKLCGSKKGGHVVYFHNRCCRNLFIIYLNEFFCESSQYNFKFDNKNRSLNLFDATKYLAENHKSKHLLKPLVSRINDLQEYIYEKFEYSFYSNPDHITIEINFKELLYFSANYIKHNFLRLDTTLSKFNKSLKRFGFEYMNNEILIEKYFDFMESILEDKFIYHTTYLIERLFPYFEEINSLFYKHKRELLYSNISWIIMQSPEDFKKRFKKLVPITDFFLIPEKERHKYQKRKEQTMKEMEKYMKELRERENSKKKI